MIDNLVLNKRYRLLKRLATGGMGEVWQASDDVLARPVAVKLLRREFSSDEAARSRFKAEARFAASLHHSGIAQVYDYGEQDDSIYLVMELVSGEPLSKIISRSGGLTPEVTLDLIAQSARALQVAHSAGIIHRDVKPGNLMVTADRTVKVTDFGIARAAAVSTLTQTGMVMGTAHYVSPEQASGQTITPATDLYSLGVVAFECLTGRPPFDADTPVGIALKHVRDVPPDLPRRIPAPVCELVRQLLAKDPAERPADAQEVADQAYVIYGSLTRGIDPAKSAQPAGPDTLAYESAKPTMVAPRPAEPAEPAETDVLTSASEESIRRDAPAMREPGLHRRSALLVMSVATGVLLLGSILVGSLLKRPQDVGLNGNGGTGPATSGSQQQSNLTGPSPPINSVGPPASLPPPVNRATAAPVLSASPTVRISVKPTESEAEAIVSPQPSTPAASSSEPPPPDPDPSTSAGSGPGS